MAGMEEGVTDSSRPKVGVPGPPGGLSGAGSEWHTQDDTRRMSSRGVVFPKGSVTDGLTMTGLIAGVTDSSAPQNCASE